MIAPQILRATGNGGGLPDDLEMRTTFIFGQPWPGPYRPTLYAANPKDEANGIDEITGIVYPVSRLRRDGFGRNVADVRASTEPEDPWLL